MADDPMTGESDLMDLGDPSVPPYHADLASPAGPSGQAGPSGTAGPSGPSSPVGLKETTEIGGMKIPRIPYRPFKYPPASPPNPVETHPDDPPVTHTIDIVGDDIVRRSFDHMTKGFAYRIADRWQDQLDVHVRAINCCNSKILMQELPRWYTREYLKKCACMIVMVGHYDPFMCAVYRQPPQNYQGYIQMMIEFFYDMGLPKSKLIFISPGFYQRRDWEEFVKNSKLPVFRKYIGECRDFSQRLFHCCHAENVKSCDFFHSTLSCKPWRTLFVNGFHLSKRGNRALNELLLSKIETVIYEHYGPNFAQKLRYPKFTEYPEIKEAIEAYADLMDEDREIDVVN